MVQDDDPFEALGHIGLVCASLNNVFRYNMQSLTPTGMYVPYFCHGVIGFIKSQYYFLRTNVDRHYAKTYPAAKYLGISFLMADLWEIELTDPEEDEEILYFPKIHILSGVIPFVLALLRKENRCLGNIAIMFNMISLGYYAYLKKNTWAWLTFSFAFFTYFIAPIHEAVRCSCLFASRMMFPVGLAMTEICATRLKDGAPDPVTMK